MLEGGGRAPVVLEAKPEGKNPLAAKEPWHGPRYRRYAFSQVSASIASAASQVSIARFVEGGVIPTSTNAVLSEVHRSWNRPEAADLAELYALVAPNYAAVMESYGRAQSVAKASN